jgi:hypothetical protein
MNDTTHIGVPITGEALRGDSTPGEPGVSPLQNELLAAFQRAYAPAVPVTLNPDQPLNPPHGT